MIGNLNLVILFGIKILNIEIYFIVLVYFFNIKQNFLYVVTFRNKIHKLSYSFIIISYINVHIHLIIIRFL